MDHENSFMSFSGSGTARKVWGWLLPAFLLTLIFFQPGLWFISALAAFKYGRRISANHKGAFGFLAAIVFLAAYVLIALFVVPVVHERTFAAIHYFPQWGTGLGAIGLSTALYLMARRWQWPRRRHMTVQGGLWVTAVVLAGLSWFNMQIPEMVEFAMEESLSIEKIDQLPNADMKNFRLLPQATAGDYARTANKEAKFELSKPHMVPCNSSGNQCWESSVHLKGRHEQVWWNIFGDTILDVITVDPTNIESNSQRSNNDGDKWYTMPNAFFIWGPDSWVVKTAFAVHNPFSEQEDALFWRYDDGTVIMLIPYISYKPTLTGVMVPYLAGVMSVNRYGMINDMSPSTAKAKFPGLAFFPTTLARKYAEVYAKWHGGWDNHLIYHLGEMRISEPDMTSSPHANPAPYVEVYEGAMSWREVMSLEPAADSGKALASFLFFDVGTGDVAEYVIPEKERWNTPRQAMANSMQANWEAQWPNSEKVETRPLLHNGRIYYAVAVITNDKDLHPYVRTVIIDGKGMSVYTVLNHDELLGLLDKLDKGIPVAPFKSGSVTSEPGQIHRDGGNH